MLNLVCGSIFLLRGLCGALCFVCYDWPNLASFRTVLLRRRIRRWPLHIWMFLLRFDTLRMSTRRLSVMLFVFSFRVTYILLFVAWCTCGGRVVFCLLPPDGV